VDDPGTKFFGAILAIFLVKGLLNFFIDSQAVQLFLIVGFLLIALFVSL